MKIERKFIYSWLLYASNLPGYQINFQTAVEEVKLASTSFAAAAVFSQQHIYADEF